MSCVLCALPCSSVVWERVKRPCGSIAHNTCSARIDLLDLCPGACCRPIGTLEGFLHGVLGDAMRSPECEAAYSGEPLCGDDIADLEALGWTYTLSRLYESGIGIPRNAKLATNYLARAVAEDHPGALFESGMRTNTLKMVERAAVLGHGRANSLMMRLYSGANVCGVTRARNPKFADNYAMRAAKRGDTLAIIQLALCDVDETTVEAELKLLDARDHNFVSDVIYQSLTERVLNMRVRRGSYEEALDLPCRRQTPNSRVDRAVAMHALGRYDDAAEQLEIAQSPDADICLAKMVQSGTYKGDADALYARAAKAGHPEAGFHFLCMYIDEPEKKTRPYFKMMLNAKDADMVLRWAAHFDEMGKCAIANALALHASACLSRQ